MLAEIGHAIWLAGAYAYRPQQRLAMTPTRYALSGAVQRRWRVALYVQQRLDVAP